MVGHYQSIAAHDPFQQLMVSEKDSSKHMICIQTPKKETFHPEILKKSNHILRNCKNADIGILTYGIPDITIPRLRFYGFEKFLFLATIFVVSMI